MNDLNRRARELIATVDDADGPNDAQRARLRAAVLARVGTGATVGAAAVVAAKSHVTASAASVAGTGAGALGGASSFAVIATKGLVVLVLAGAAMTGYVHVRERKAAAPVTVSPAALAPLVAARATPASTTNAAPQSTIAPPPKAPPASVPTTPEIRASDAPVVAPRPRPSSSSEALDGLAEETNALESALTELRDGRPLRALSLLAEQEARYGLGALGEERAATRIDALCMLGRTAEAREATARFVLDHPRTLLAPRVQATCGASTPP
jgi:hypothetical protein